MKIKELSLRQARRLCSVHKKWCEDCPFNRKCLSSYMTDLSNVAKQIGEEKVPESSLAMLKKEGILW